MNLARRCSGQLVTSRPARRSVPSSTRNDPAAALRNVDFPEPLVPMTMTNEPASIARSTPSSARTSLAVQAEKVLRIPMASNIPSSQQCPQAAHLAGQNQGQNHEDRGEELQVIGIQTRQQHHRSQKAKEHGSHDGADQRQPEL